MEKRQPKRRFKDFQSRGDWEEKKLGEIGTTFTGLSGKTKKDFGHGEAEFVTYMNVFSNTISNDSETESVELDNKQNQVRYGDIFFTTSSETPEEVGMSSVWLGKRPNVYLNSFCFGYRLIKYQSPYFMAYMLRSPSVRKNFRELAQGISRYNISKNRVMDIKVPIPPLEEQKKIGDFFQRLDRLIDLNRSRLDKLRKTKEAYLVELFPREGESYPRRRFPGFTGPWEEKIIKDICSISTGKSNTQDRDNLGIYPFYVRSSVVEYSNKYLYDEEAVLTVGDGVGTGKVFHYVKGKYDLHQRVYRMFNFKDVIGKYFYYYFSTNFYNRAMTMTAKTSVDSVRFEMISDMKILFPSYNEQKKIVKFLDKLDGLIAKEEERLDKLENLKKAYLNELFV